MFQFLMFLPLLILCNQHRLAGSTEIPKPHPSCTYAINPHEEPPTTTSAAPGVLPPLPRNKLNKEYVSHLLHCTNASLEIPTNFDVSHIPSDVDAVHLDCPHSSDNQTGPYCNMVHDTAQPFPLLSRLRMVSLARFTTQNAKRFPMNALLTNVKHQITSLYIEHSKIGSLDADYFKGFYALTSLNLNNNDIAEIAPDTFQQISQSPGVSVLTRLRIADNRISTFDWAVLQPLADSLEWFDIADQKPGLQTITRSTPKFIFKKLVVELDMDGNNLSGIPQEILDSIDLSQESDDSEVQLSMEGNPFCPLSPNCSCCQMKPFFDWINNDVAKATGNLVVIFLYDCGPVDNDRITTYSSHARNSTFGTRATKRFTNVSRLRAYDRSYPSYPVKFDRASLSLC